MKKMELSLLIGMIMALIFAGLSSFADSYGRITDNVFRLHIRANSDSEADQELKYLVRDEILSRTSEFFQGSESADTAALKALERLAEFETAARSVLTENVYDYDVECEVKDVYFPARSYGDITLPAGIYKALEINIGDSRGENWWCIMFPPLCLPAVSKKDDVVIQEEILCGVFNEREMQMLQNPEKYEVRFYFAEFFQKLTRKNK